MSQFSCFFFPGAFQSVGKHHEGNCQRDFICPHQSHDRYTCKKHVFVCHDHATNQENDQILKLYKQRCIYRQQSIPDFSKDIKLTFHSNVESSYLCNPKSLVGKDSVSNRAIHILQTINVDGKRCTIFFDLGCGDMVIRKQAASNFNHRSQLEYKGDVRISGVGQSSQKSMGIYKIKLPLYNGQDATMSGVCLHSITTTFPTYPLQKVEMDTVFSRVSARGAHLIFGSQRGALIRGGALSREALIKKIKLHNSKTFFSTNNRKNVKFNNKRNVFLRVFYTSMSMSSSESSSTVRNGGTAS